MKKILIGAILVAIALAVVPTGASGKPLSPANPLPPGYTIER